MSHFRTKRKDPLAATVEDYLIKRRNPWFRETDSHRAWYSSAQNYLKESRREFSRLTVPRFELELDNAFPDIHSKKAVMKISSSVVTLVSYSGDLTLNQCSGVIIENDGNNGYIILTSAKLIRRPNPEQERKKDVLANNLKVFIGMCDGGSHMGTLCAFDFHYNLAWIKFRSNSSHPTAKLTDLNDFMNVNPSKKKNSDFINLNPSKKKNKKSSFHLVPRSNNIVPGDSIISVGRYFIPPYELMSAPGKFILARCNLDCKELFMGTCNITKCGEGGVIINISGQVVGITIYFENGFPTPFLPINIALRCWENYKTYGEPRRPSLMGFEATNLYATYLYLIEKIIQKFPSICNGVVIEKVSSGSSADFAGLQSNDVIVRCGRKTVHSFLEFLDIFLETKVGDELPLSVVRVDENDLIHVNMVVNEVAVENINRWPQNLSSR